MQTLRFYCEFVKNICSLLLDCAYNERYENQLLLLLLNQGP